MAGLLLELRKQLYKKHSRDTYKKHSQAEQRNDWRPSIYTLEEEKPDTQAAERDAEESSVDNQDFSAEGFKTLERTQSVVNKEDVLLKQIDEFRERAKELQVMLDTRESQAKELQSIVDERQEKADTLGQILQERQEKADGITAEVEKQIDALIEKVSIKMDEIESSVKDDIGENKKLSKEQAQEMKESLVQIQEQLGQVKGELADKVHTENVKCYRNIQDLFKSMDEKLDRLEPVERSLGATKNCVIVTMVFTIVNFVGIIGVLLLNFLMF